jgi:hypothetical protein
MERGQLRTFQHRSRNLQTCATDPFLTDRLSQGADASRLSHQSINPLRADVSGTCLI